MEVCKICGKHVELNKDKIFKTLICNCTDSYGKLTPIRQRRTKNIFILYSDCAEIIIVNKDKIEVVRTLVDLDDVEKLITHKWNVIFPGPYIVNTGRYSKNGNAIRLNRFLMNVSDKDILVDHINNNTLDNRKLNLRLANKIENGRNSLRPKNNSSGVKGVCWCPDRKKYKVTIVVNYKQIFLGRYETLTEAESVIRSARIQYHGEHANHG